MPRTEPSRADQSEAQRFDGALRDRAAPRVGPPARHVLLVPSEEYVPPNDHLAGIFQLHQAAALRAAGYRVGVLSLRQAYSIPMIARGALARTVGRRVQNPLDELSLAAMGRLLVDKMRGHERFITIDERQEAAVVRAEGFYWLPPSERTNHRGWVRAGVAAYDAYVRRYGRPDVLHAHNTNPAGLLAYRLHRRHGVPYVITEHSSYYERGLVPRGLYPALRRAITAAGAVAVVSPALGRTLERELGDCARDAIQIPNVLDPEVIGAPVRRVGDDGFTFLAIGGLIPLKNHGLLLDAFHARFAHCPAIRLRIGGDGPLSSELAARARALGLDGRVRLLGRLDRGTVVRELDACDALVLPSAHETFGVVLIEALARGTPVVASRCGGPDTVVTGDDGLLVPPNDARALGDAMATMVRDRARYDADGIRRRAIERFGPDALVRRLGQLYARAPGRDG